MKPYGAERSPGSRGRRWWWCKCLQCRVHGHRLKRSAGKAARQAGAREVREGER